jgi:hypothetical protein
MPLPSYLELVESLKKPQSMVGIENKALDGVGKNAVVDAPSSKFATETSVVGLQYDPLKASTNSTYRGHTPEFNKIIVYNVDEPVHVNEIETIMKETDVNLDRMGGATAVTSTVNNQLKQEQPGTNIVLQDDSRDKIRWSPDDTNAKLANNFDEVKVNIQLAADSKVLSATVLCCESTTEWIAVSQQVTKRPT